MHRRDPQQVRSINPRIIRELEGEGVPLPASGPQIGALNGPQGSQAPKMKNSKMPFPPPARGAGQPIKGKPPKMVPEDLPPAAPKRRSPFGG